MKPPGTDRMGDSKESSGGSAPKFDQKFDGPSLWKLTVKKTVKFTSPKPNQKTHSRVSSSTSASPRVDAKALKPSSDGAGISNLTARAEGSSDHSLSQSKGGKRRNERMTAEKTAELAPKKPKPKTDSSVSPSTSASLRVDAEASEPSLDGTGVLNPTARAEGLSDQSLSRDKGARKRNEKLTTEKTR